jgi:hypothetical protein
LREELHHLIDELSERRLRPALELIRGLREEEAEEERDLPFSGSFGADADASVRYEEILRSKSSG